MRSRQALSAAAGALAGIALVLAIRARPPPVTGSDDDIARPDDRTRARPLSMQRNLLQSAPRDTAPSPSSLPPPPPLPASFGARCAAADAHATAHAAARELEAAESLQNVLRWQSAAAGDVCSGVGKGCRTLHKAVPAGGGGDADGDGDGGGGGGGGCAASRSCKRRGRPPRVHVSSCMDGPHRTLLGAPHVSAFFDANLARNQYLSEYALHRSLLLYRHRVADPAHADFHFVPFYARLAYADKVASAHVHRLQANLTAALAACLTSSAAWKRSGGRDHLLAVSSTRDPRKLFGPAWPYLRKATLLRIEAADQRYASRQREPGRDRREGQLIVPYYVPHFAEDEAVTCESKTHPVCFLGSTTNKLRARAVAALQRGVDGAVLSLGAFAAFNGSAGARLGERRRTLATRQTLRRCQLCLVPAGITPSSRRFYEAIVAKCVPLLLADRFEPAFANLLPLESYTVRARQAEPEALPRVVADALRRWPALFQGVEAARSALIYSLGTRARSGAARRQRQRCDATHSMLTELHARFAHRASKPREERGPAGACLRRRLVPC